MGNESWLDSTDCPAKSLIFLVVLQLLFHVCSPSSLQLSQEERPCVLFRDSSHWVSPSRSSLGDDVIITSHHRGTVLSHEKPLAKQSTICLIPTLLLLTLTSNFSLDLKDMLGLAFLQPFLWRTSYSSWFCWSCQSWCCLSQPQGWATVQIG